MSFEAYQHNPPGNDAFQIGAVNVSDALLSLQTTLIKGKSQIQCLLQLPSDENTRTITAQMHEFQKMLASTQKHLTQWKNDAITQTPGKQSNRVTLLAKQFESSLHSEAVKFEELKKLVDSCPWVSVSNPLTRNVGEVEDNTKPYYQDTSNLFNSYTKSQGAITQICNSTDPSNVREHQTSYNYDASSFLSTNDSQSNDHYVTQIQLNEIRDNSSISPLSLDHNRLNGMSQNNYYLLKNSPPYNPASQTKVNNDSNQTNSIKDLLISKEPYDILTQDTNQQILYDSSTNIQSDPGNYPLFEMSLSPTTSSNQRSSTQDQQNLEFLQSSISERASPAEIHLLKTKIHDKKLQNFDNQNQPDTYSQSTTATGTMIALHQDQAASDDQFVQNDYDSCESDDELDNELKQLLQQPVSINDISQGSWQTSSSALQNYISTEKIAGMDRIRQQAHQLLQVFHDFDHLVHHQQTDIDLFEETIMQIGGSSLSAVDELRRASRRKQATRRRQVLCVFSLFIAFAMIYLIISIPTTTMSFLHH